LNNESISRMVLYSGMLFLANNRLSCIYVSGTNPQTFAIIDKNIVYDNFVTLTSKLICIVINVLTN
jgi:hypothetical protein